jgi:hypothetical protein
LRWWVFLDIGGFPQPFWGYKHVCALQCLTLLLCAKLLLTIPNNVASHSPTLNSWLGSRSASTSTFALSIQIGWPVSVKKVAAILPLELIVLQVIYEAQGHPLRKAQLAHGSLFVEKLQHTSDSTII